jgi:hypothetical protein
MKIEFDDRSYLEISKGVEPEKVYITIQAKDHLNSLKKITNSVEISLEDFKKIYSEVNS